MTSTEVAPSARAARISSTSIDVMGRAHASSPQDARHADPAVLGRGSTGEDDVARQARTGDVGAHDVGHRDRVRRRRDLLDRGLPHLGDGVEHGGQLTGEEIELLVGHRQPGEVRQVRHLVTGELALRGERAHAGAGLHFGGARRLGSRPGT